MPSPAPFDRRARRPVHSRASGLPAWAQREVTLRDLERTWRRLDRRRSRRQALEASWWVAFVVYSAVAWFGAYEALGAVMRLLG